MKIAIPAYLWLKDDGGAPKDHFWLKPGVGYAKRTGS